MHLEGRFAANLWLDHERWQGAASGYCTIEELACPAQAYLLPVTVHCRAFAGQDTVDMRSNVEALRWPLGVPKLDTAPNRALQAVLDELRRQRGAYMFLRVARRYTPCQHGNSQW